MTTAEIITIGTELLLGEIIDTNARYLARVLRDHGIDVYRTSSVGDNSQRIAQSINESRHRADIVITTGGLGPTIDDDTRSAVATAYGTDLVFHEELWLQVISRFKKFNKVPTDNNKRQAYIPRRATPIENPVGTAPSFLMDTVEGVVVCLPGVPSEMEFLVMNAVLPYLTERFKLSEVIVVRVLHTAGAGESQIDELILDLEKMDNPTVGLAAHAGQIDVRITAKSKNKETALAIIKPIEDEIYSRLGRWIYGVDDESLSQVVYKRMVENGWSLSAFEAGLAGEMIRTLSSWDSSFLSGERNITPVTELELIARTENLHETSEADVALGVSLDQEPDMIVKVHIITPLKSKTYQLPYGGPQKLAVQRAINNCLHLLNKSAYQNDPIG